MTPQETLNSARKIVIKIGSNTLAKKDGTIDLYNSFLRQGITALKLDKLPEATQSLINATKMNSIAFEPNYYLGQTMSKLEQYDKAIPLFKKALLEERVRLTGKLKILPQKNTHLVAF